MRMSKRTAEAPPAVYLVVIGVILILVGVVTTPVYFDLGNAAFWIGVLLLAIGLAAIILG